MPNSPHNSLYSPLDGPLEEEKTRAPQRSPPAMVSLVSDLRRNGSHAGGTDSTFYLMSAEYDDVSRSYEFQRDQRANSSGGRRKAASSANVGRPGGLAQRSFDQSDGNLRKQRGPYNMSTVGMAPDEGLTANAYGSYADMNDDAVECGGAVGLAGSFSRPSSMAPTMPGHDMSITSDTALPFPKSSSPSSAPTSRPTGLDEIGVPPAMLQGSRRAQPPHAPKTSSPSPRTRGAGVAPAVAAPGGIRLDSILMSSSQIVSGALSPSRESGGKRGSRFVGYTEEDAAYTGSFGRVTCGSGGSNTLFSPSASEHRKRGSVSADTFTGGVRSFDSPASSMESGRSLHVNLAHKALIGKGSYGMVFQAMDRDTNRIIAVKEIALDRSSGAGSGRRSAGDSTAGDGAKRPPVNEDAVMVSASSTPVSNVKGSASSGKHSGNEGKSPTKANQLNDFQRQLESVRKELAVLKQLDHPNIVKCLGEECDEGFLRIYMEYVAGGSVTSVIRKFGNLQERQASTFTRQVLEGLTYLHSKGIAHRDLKGDNLLVDTDGTLKLADFGTARNVQAQTLSNAIAGTAYFMAPEVISGEPFDVKSDIWSVGCCVIEMLTGKPPLPHLTNQYGIMMFVAQSKGELADVYIPADNNWSPEALDFLRQCLTRSSAKRPSAQQLLSHPWIVNPTRDDNIRSPTSTALTSKAIANLPTPPPVSRLLTSENLNGTVSSATDTDVQSITPSSERSRKHKKEKKKREKEKEKERKSSKKPHARTALDPSKLGPDAEEYNLGPDLFFSSKGSGPASHTNTSPAPAGGLISPRWLHREGRRRQLSPGIRGASFENDLLPDIRAHSSAATSLRSPFLPSLSGEKTPTSTHAFIKSNSSSQRGVFAEAGSSRRSKGYAVPLAPGGRGSGNDFLSDKGSGQLTKSTTDSKDAETPVKGGKREQNVDDVLTGKDDSTHNAPGHRELAIALPSPSLRKQKAGASPRVPPLLSPTARRK